MIPSLRTSFPPPLPPIARSLTLHEIHLSLQKGISLGLFFIREIRKKEVQFDRLKVGTIQSLFFSASTPFADKAWILLLDHYTILFKDWILDSFIQPR